MTYVLRALDKEGNRYFYTGKAGMDWLSFYPYEAFAYHTRQAAHLKAMRFNKMEQVHGYWFIPLEMEMVR
jgi:hypothetical protein